MTVAESVPVVPSRDELVNRAAELMTKLAGRQAEVDATRRIPQESLDELREAGMFRLSVPRDYGGYALDLPAYVDVMAELSKGCPSTAWVVSIHNSAAGEAGIFSRQAQDEVFGANPDARLASVPQAKVASARPVEGGLHIEHAKWFFNSGVTIADWAVNGVPVTDDDGNLLDLVMCLIPAAELTLNDDWHTIGMRGTQSVSSEARDLFVPAHRTVSSLAVLTREHCSPHGLDQRLYHGAQVPTLALFVAPNGIGMAEAALARFTQKAQGRPVVYTTIENQAADALVQSSVGEARMKIDAARELTKRAAAEVDRYAATGSEMPVAERIRARVQCSYALKLSWEAVDLLYSLSGGSAIAEFEPMQRYWRDVKTATLHGLFAPSTTLELQGRVELGFEANTLFV
ncbi:acyl-CoA dehydrogenase family protein [Sphaerisporangium fuscum]|uniref:acyl-CoA dehydrogenase family protein n=1 Tax=Sphaerisporangium fuscum TaxID=2835868 RepID=UPI001BDC03C9|nr:acyl-CoA dehydrogenase family protein [Sphaerisporangium fuscum]